MEEERFKFILFQQSNYWIIKNKNPFKLRVIGDSR